MPVIKIASKKVTTCTDADPIRKCLELMLGKSIHAVPVVDSRQKLVGLVTSTDLLKLLLDLI
jgi:CBS domain-containing protein